MRGREKGEGEGERERKRWRKRERERGRERRMVYNHRELKQLGLRGTHTPPHRLTANIDSLFRTDKLYQTARNVCLGNTC